MAWIEVIPLEPATGLLKKEYWAAIRRAVCRFAEKLTLFPAEMSEIELDRLRDAGFDDRAIHDGAQVVSYFNYINRVADALGVHPEAFVRHWEVPLTPP